jgi:hypothetical protein
MTLSLCKNSFYHTELMSGKCEVNLEIDSEQTIPSSKPHMVWPDDISKRLDQVLVSNSDKRALYSMKEHALTKALSCLYPNRVCPPFL